MVDFKSYGRRLLIVLIVQTAVYFLGIYVFTQGFLLNRLVVPKHSTCQDRLANFTVFDAHGGDINSCWRPARFKKAVFVVIDALRYDFMLYNESLESQNALSFQNKLGVIRDILKQTPSHGRIFKFVADPPTTTMQRIKGLTTGSLPTFIDAGSNFASSEIHEDNIISQLLSLGKKIVFMGDDTWMGLFPNSFARYYPFPSFNVKDLHTVDDGVIAHLIPEIQKHDWDVIVAHFLGVDHCGHRYGPYHTAMAKKLTQMDQILRSVVNELNNDTILMVFGDHGMTKTGDHGGDSEDEVHAGLFIFSPGKIFADPQLEDDVVSQTDIVPTISLLLGLPVPFSNLGIVMSSLFKTSNDASKLHALQLNARQVYRYLAEYSKLSNDISVENLERITRHYLEGETSFSSTLDSDKENYNYTEALVEILRREKAYRTYLSEIRTLCRKVWAKFDLNAIQIGAFITTMSCVISLILISIPEKFLDDSFFKEIPRSGILGALTVLGFVLFYEYALILLLVYFSCGILALMKFYANVVGYMMENVAHATFKTIAISVLLCVHFVGFFSNSFVVHEDKILLFFLQTVMIILAAGILTKSLASAKLLGVTDVHHRVQKRKGKKKKGFGWPVLSDIRLELICLFLIMLLYRFGALFWACREEQAPCEQAEFLKQSKTSSERKALQFWFPSAAILLVPILLIFRLRAYGNLNGGSCLVLAVKYALPFSVLFACAHWLLQYIPSKMIDQNPAIGFLQQILAPCIVYCCCFGTLICLLYEPITVFLVKPRDLYEPTMPTHSIRHVVVKIFKQLRSEMNGTEENESNIPRVYGLGTVYSSAILILLTCFALPVALVLGDSLGASVILMMAEMYLFLVYDGKMTSRESSSGSLLFPVLMWTMMSSQTFFSSGHQATIPSIRFEAAFVGLPGDMQNFVLPGFLILLNTFASDVLFTIALPLIIFWRKQTSSRETTEDKDRSHIGEFLYRENPVMLRSDLFRICVMYQVCKGFKLLGTMSAAAVHRRHLMVWKIFAPKFVFEGVSFILTSVILILMNVFLLRVDSALNTWCNMLQSW